MLLVGSVVGTIAASKGDALGFIVGAFCFLVLVLVLRDMYYNDDSEPEADESSKPKTVNGINYNLGLPLPTSNALFNKREMDRLVETFVRGKEHLYEKSPMSIERKKNALSKMDRIGGGRG